ncbi:hypothetical protein KFK09_016755 [Dendrobium nobile]|uniref:Uncharacterized protein n=1 Tax=Dendrobium nobile TaxID=94219 RepID=A0A8T3B0E1_DENNO|nr:hypothetical protein KFK09_016755 [Dendrobium nobile]
MPLCKDWFSLEIGAAMMEKFLLSLSEDQAAGGEAILNTIKFAVLPFAKVFTVCFIGFLMASKYVSILPANGRKLLNGSFRKVGDPIQSFSQEKLPPSLKRREKITANLLLQICKGVGRKLLPFCSGFIYFQ